MSVTISTSDISELRERTGAGLVECKKALIEAEGNIQKAVDTLRQRGLASAAKKSGKIAAEGAVIAKVTEDQSKGVLLELNSQTDFVAKNEKFQILLNQILELALSENISSLEELRNAKISSGETISDLIALKTAEIGEKLDLRRFVSFNAAEGQKISQYTHPIGSKIAVLVKLASENASVGREVAMHIAAVQPTPEYLSRDEISEDVINKEKEIESGKADLAGKPADIVDKIVSGRVEKVLLEKVLLEQPFIKNPNQKIKDFLKEQKAEVLEFLRFGLGEGIEKAESNFAEEVAAQMKQ